MKELFEDVKKNLSLIEDIYDNIRIVNPLNKKVLNIKNTKIEQFKGNCYDLWKNGEICDNCISMRAYNELDTFVKIESSFTKVMFIIVTPIYLNGELYVLEVLKDISKASQELSLCVDDVIDKLNEKIIIDSSTGLYNRKYIEERLPVDVNSSIIEKYPLSLINIEVDNFKTIVEEFGIHIKEKIILHICDIVNNINIEEISWIGRYNDNQLFIELKNVNKNRAIDLSEKILKKLNSKLFNYNNININLNYNFGVYCTENEKIDGTNFFDEIDKKLFKEKIKRKVDKLVEVKNVEKNDLSKLSCKMEELRSILNSMCADQNYLIYYEDVVYVSQCLDKLIVAYMKCFEKNKLENYD